MRGQSGQQRHKILLCARIYRPKHRSVQRCGKNWCNILRQPICAFTCSSCSTAGRVCFIIVSLSMSYTPSYNQTIQPLSWDWTQWIYLRVYILCIHRPLQTQSTCLQKRARQFLRVLSALRCMFKIIPSAGSSEWALPCCRAKFKGWPHTTTNVWNTKWREPVTKKQRLQRSHL